MYRLLILAMLTATFKSLSSHTNCLLQNESADCSKQIQQAVQHVLHIDWKPISVWPEEAKRFR